jgi:uncharacterized Zn finger protein
MKPDWPRNAPKLPAPERGIKVQKIGATWWGQRWLEALERLSRDYLSRLGRGRAYARAGRVHDLKVEPGIVTAGVTGSDLEPYEVTLRIAMLDNKTWNSVLAQMSKQALYTAQLLAGQMPHEIDRVFRACGVSLFPFKQRDIETDCSCPDWANPCKHVAATHYVLGEAFDKDPFLLFELRGRNKEQVLAALSSRRAGQRGMSARDIARKRSAKVAQGKQPIPSVSLLGKSGDDFETPANPPPRLSFRIESPPVSAAVLRQLGPPPGWSAKQSPVELLGPLYEKASALARELATREKKECDGEQVEG